MVWDGVLELASQVTMDVLPDILVVHWGGNDLAQRSGKSLVLQVIADLRVFVSWCVIWSAVIQCLVWKAACDTRRIDWAWKGINRQFSRAVWRGLRSVVIHPHFKVSHPELYREDGVHLSDQGLDIFLEDLQGGLRAEMFQLVGGMGHTK